MSELFTTPVREYMSKALISVRPDAALDEVRRVLDERDVSAAPVVDAAGALVGVVSTTDLLREASVTFSPAGRVTSWGLPARTAAELMRREVVTVADDEPLRAAAARMIDARVHRVIVLRGGAPVGVLSARDALRAVLFHHVTLPLGAVMSSPVLGVPIGATIDEAVAALASASVHGLAVIDGARAVGLFTQREALGARALPAALRALPVEGVMSYELLTLERDTPLYRVAGHAIQTRVRRVFVSEGAQIVGVVTGFDLVRVMTRDDA